MAVLSSNGGQPMRSFPPDHYVGGTPITEWPIPFDYGMRPLSPLQHFQNPWRRRRPIKRSPTSVWLIRGRRAGWARRTDGGRIRWLDLQRTRNTDTSRRQRNHSDKAFIAWWTGHRRAKGRDANGGGGVGGVGGVGYAAGTVGAVAKEMKLELQVEPATSAVLGYTGTRYLTDAWPEGRGRKHAVAQLNPARHKSPCRVGPMPCGQNSLVARFVRRDTSRMPNRSFSEDCPCR